MAQTAMQVLKDKLQVVVDELNDAKPETDQYGYRSAMENVIKDIDAQMLAKERQDIIDFANWLNINASVSNKLKGGSVCWNLRNTGDLSPMGRFTTEEAYKIYLTNQ